MDRLSEITERMKRVERHGELVQYVRLLAKFNSGVETLAGLSPHEAAAREADRLGLRQASRWLKSAVDAQALPDGDLTSYRAFTSEWASLLSARTLLGRIQGWRKVDFNTRTLAEDTPGMATWVGQGEAYPVASLSLDTLQLDISKMGGIVVFTREEVEAASAAAVSNVNRALLNTVGRYSDRALLDPTIAAVTGKNPASLTNAGTGIAGGSTATEAGITTLLKALLQEHINAGADLTTVYFALHPTSALHLAGLLTAGNVRAFPNMGVHGGDIWGIPALTTVGAEAAGSPSERVVAAINPTGIALADDGEVSFTPARHAAIQMDDAPSNKSTPTATGAQLVSLWQTESVGVRFSRTVNWKAMTGAVSYALVTW